MYNIRTSATAREINICEQATLILWIWALVTLLKANQLNLKHHNTSLHLL